MKISPPPQKKVNMNHNRWTCARKRFYMLCLDGLSVQITCNYMMEDLDDEQEIEKYIIEHLSYDEHSIMGRSRPWFNGRKFGDMLKDPGENDMVHRVLDYFEDRDLGVMETFLESCLEDEKDEKFARDYAEHGFPDQCYGWYLLKTQHKFHKLWPITNFWWREAGKNQHREHGRGRIRSREEFNAWNAV